MASFLCNILELSPDTSQCDRASPNCRRCIVHGVPCPGYPQVQDAMFRHQTVKIASKAVSRVFFEGISVHEEQRNEPVSYAAEQSLPPPPIRDSLGLSDTFTSTCYFMHQLVISVGWFALIPKLYEASGPGECLKRAVDAASMFLYANRTGKVQLSLQARHLYSFALSATTTAISDPMERLRDETLCAILILSITDVSTP